MKELADANQHPVVSGVIKRSPREGSELFAAKTRWQILFAVPLAVAIALAVHWFAGNKEPPGETHLYTYFLGGLLVAAVAAAALQSLWSKVREWMRDVCPLIAIAVLFLTVWELLTAGFRLLPLPYFPSPAGVLQSLVNDRGVLFDSTWHSLILLLSGYGLGVAVGLFSGICIGWFPHARYWGMPVLKIVGPIPATAWIPLAMVLSPSAMFSAVALIALAVWFPVTMLTASGALQHPYLLPRCGPYARRRSDIPHLPCRHPGSDAEHLPRPVHGTWSLVFDTRSRRNRRA